MVSRGTRAQLKSPALVTEASITPLAHMLAVINDPNADARRKDRMAVAAAPYVHPRPMAVGKKRQAAKAAVTAGAGTEWASDLDGPWPQ
jgi:hypothetical protein